MIDRNKWKKAIYRMYEAGLSGEAIKNVYPGTEKKVAYIAVVHALKDRFKAEGLPMPLVVVDILEELKKEIKNGDSPGGLTVKP